MAERSIAISAPRSKGSTSLWLPAIPVAIAFVAMLVSTITSSPPIPAIVAGVYVVFLALYLALSFRRAPDLAFILPTASIFSVFVLFPALQAFRLSLYDWRGYTVNPTTFEGLQNYLKIIDTGEFINALWHGIALFALMFILQNTLSLGLAMFLDTRLHFFELYRAVLFLPVIISGIATGFIWQVIFGSNIGLVNPLLQSIGLTNWQQDWQGEPPWVFWVITLVSFWSGNGFAVVIYLAGLQGIPGELKEAARIDGANSFQVFLNVIFPLLAPAFTVMTGLTFIGTMKALEVPMLIGGLDGGPFASTDFLNLVIVRSAFGGSSPQYNFLHDPAYGVAVGVVMFLIILILVSLQLVFLRRREVSL